MSTAVDTAVGTSTTDFLLPDLGEGLTEAEVVRWLVAEGDTVAVDQPVVEVETAKATVEVPSPYAGHVATLHAPEGAVVEVGRPLISFASGAPASGGASAGSGAGDAAVSSDAADPEGSGRVLIGYGTQPSGAGRRRRPRRGPVGGGASAAAAASAAATVPAPGVRVGSAAAPGPGVDGAGVLAAAADRAPSSTGSAPAEKDTAPVAGVAPPGGSAGPAADPGAPAGPVLVVSPVVRALAVRNGLELAGVAGSGPGGVITRQDVNAALAERDLRRAAQAGAGIAPRGTRAAGAPAAGTPTALGHGGPEAVAQGAGHASGARPEPRADGTAVPGGTGVAGAGAAYGAPRDGTYGTRPEAGTGTGTGTGVDGVERVPLKGVRGAIARKLTQAAAVPTATVWVDVDATELLALRARQGADGPGLLALLARFTVAGLRRYPELNATVRDDEILRYRDVHLGVAAQTDAGLLVPVVRGADRMSARALHAEVSALIGRARGGGLSPAELTGGTFTLNNFGVFGVDGSSMLLNAPEAGILGVGRIVERPWSVDGQILSRKTTQLSLVFDHRVCDGGAAGGFLRFVADCIEDPVRALADL